MEFFKNAKEQLIKLTANPASGAYSWDALALKDIHKKIEAAQTEEEISALLKELSDSANNHEIKNLMPQTFAVYTQAASFKLG